MAKDYPLPGFHEPTREEFLFGRLTPKQEPRDAGKVTWTFLADGTAISLDTALSWIVDAAAKGLEAARKYQHKRTSLEKVTSKRFLLWHDEEALRQSLCELEILMTLAGISPSDDPTAYIDQIKGKRAFLAGLQLRESLLLLKSAGLNWNAKEPDIRRPLAIDEEGLRALETAIESLRDAMEVADEPKARLQIDEQTQTVTLDGKPYPIENPKAFLLNQAIAKSTGPVTRAKLRQSVSGIRGDKTIPRLRAQLPRALKNTVKSSNLGYWLQLPRAK